MSSGAPYGTPKNHEKTDRIRMKKKKNKNETVALDETLNFGLNAAWFAFMLLLLLLGFLTKCFVMYSN